MKHYVSLLALFALGSFSAAGGLITSPPAGSTTIVFAGGSGCTGTVDAGFVIGGGPCVNYSGFYGFGQNGFWNDPPSGFPLIGNSIATSSILINLGGLYSSVGGFVNYFAPVPAGSGPGTSSDSARDEIPSASADPLIIALAANGTTVLGTYDISVLDPISTPGGSNAGAFVGIEDATNDIGYLELSNDYLSIHSITFGTAESSNTPEPSAFLLLGSGLGLVYASRRRRVAASR